MIYDDVLDAAQEKMEKTAQALKKEYASLRAGRANPQILDRIHVDYYGAQTPLAQMANISAPEPRLLVISVWDPKAIPLVEKAILKSDIGITPTNDGKVIRLMVPELNEERRRDLCKIVGKQSEEAKVAVRGARREAVDQLEKMKKNSEITEDDLKEGKEDIQKRTDKMIKEIDKIAEDKTKEIMEV